MTFMAQIFLLHCNDQIKIKKEEGGGGGRRLDPDK